MTLREALTAATALLQTNEALRGSASRDAQLLLLTAADVSHATLLAYPERQLTDAQHTRFWQSIHRRQRNEPIQYILGTQEFYGLAFHVTPAVLIPRPETELLVEAVLQRLPHDTPLRIADVGTGSGILAVTLAVHLPQAEMTAIDIFPEALAVARQNAVTHQVADRIRWVESDLLTSVAATGFAAIVSNPPYIPVSDLSTLHPEVRDYEPHTALFAGTTGLDLYERLIPQALAGLVPGGLLALEIGFGQVQAVRGLLGDWKDLYVLQDLQGIPRTVIAHKP